MKAGDPKYLPAARLRQRCQDLVLAAHERPVARRVSALQRTDQNVRVREFICNQVPSFRLANTFKQRAGVLTGRCRGRVLRYGTRRAGSLGGWGCERRRERSVERAGD